MSKRKTKEYIRIFLSVAPEPIRSLKFDIPKKDSCLEGYLLYRWENYLSIVNLKSLENIICLELDRYEFDNDDPKLNKRKLKKILYNLESKIFTTKKKIWEKRFKYICPLLIALISSSFTFILSKIFK